MKALAWVVVVAGIVGVWQVGGRLSADAMSMLVGLLAGSLAGIPAALLTLYAVRNSDPPPPRRDVYLDRNERSQKTITSNYSEIGRLLE